MTTNTMTPWLALAAILTLTSIPARAHAHPGAGIVVDRTGTVYFVVLGSSHLMKWRTGEKATVFVSDDRIRLPHHLTHGRDGFIYVVSDDDGRVFRVDGAGGLQLHFDTRSARPSRQSRQSRLQIGAWGDPFTVDSVGNIYGLGDGDVSVLVRVSLNGTVVPIAAGTRFGELHFRGMAIGPDGALYLTDASRVWRIRGDSAEAIVPRGVTLAFPDGIALEEAGNIYVADVEARRVVRLAPDGEVNTPAYLAEMEFRGPTGVAARSDTVYVLDNAPGSTAVWRVAPDDSGRVYTQSFWKWHLRTMVAGLPILLVTLLAADRYQKRTSVSTPAS
ncbi:MAG: hypothetical protein ACREOK_12060 [Gemmatimonadaceae bacterium]